MKNKYKELSQGSKTEVQETPVEEAKVEENQGITETHEEVQHQEVVEESQPQHQEAEPEPEPEPVEEKSPAEYLSEYEALDATDKQLDQTIEDLASVKEGKRFDFLG